MARFNYELTMAKIEKFKNERRGEGDLETYKPWITVRDLASKGRSSREFGVKVKREYHLLSDLERYFFYIAEWSDNIVDIKEQFPILEREKTMEIAEILGFKHPKDTKTKVNAVVTVDFLISFKNKEGEIKTVGRSIKPSSELIKKRTIEKLLIEKHYFESIGIDWAIVTEREINKNLAVNIQELREYLLRENQIDKGVTDFLLSKMKTLSKEGVIMEDIKHISQVEGFRLDELLTALKVLIATKQIPFNLNQRLDFNKTWSFYKIGG
ncbi:heteromeric transposase endonuclease subunit TnsA [Pontibacillus yanchengensis]|uniref:Heteromeric transposase endonuclease subunit TnsA n=1 Tax=Pontibacillus yanchengensis TaxID=462910 RepID=A0ACC7VJA0_9BACI|nr:TnsA endonuclease N-terminal domain-containing protein [Pontibacillus yanchengensis]MYL54024.1 heteromeric transposase endonuclease subunit TnsA [Pontibacillus yanchengensis]